MSNIRRINKQEAARRQLDAAIEWFFEGGDLLPIYNIGSSVFVLTENLAARASLESTFYGVMRANMGSEEFKNLKNEMGQKHGFLKHGDRNLTEVFDVNIKQAAAILYFASENYIQLFKEQSSQMILIKAYLYASLGSATCKELGLDEEYSKKIIHFEVIAQQEGLDRLKEVIGRQLQNYKLLKNGTDRSTHKMQAT